MAARTIAIKDVLEGLNCTVLINDVSGAAAEILQIQDVKTTDVIVTEEIEEVTTPTVSTSVERNKILSRRVTVQFDINENETDVISTVAGLSDGEGEIIVTTAEGGDNGTGKTFTVTAANIKAYLVENFKTRFILTKKTTGNTLGFSVAHVAAA